MKHFAVMACLVLGMHELAGCSCEGGIDSVDLDSSPPPDEISPIDAPTVCDPVSQTGCSPDQKCTWIVDEAGPPDLGHTGCATDGGTAAGEPCASPGTGADDCVRGYFCMNAVCTEICTSVSDSCPDDFVCSTYRDLMSDFEHAGLCNPSCDPVLQDCEVETDGCYLQSVTGEASCARIPASAAELVQGDDCYGPAAGTCYLNGCAKGYGANLPIDPDSTTDVCAFFCNPIDNWSGNVQGVTGDPNGITCAFDGTAENRPDGPGSSFECRYIQTFYLNTDEVSASTGMCLNPADWGGSCADFDKDGLAADITSGAYDSETYCDDNPTRCMFDCISLEILDAMFVDAKVRPQWERFKATVVKRFWDQRPIPTF